MLQGKAPPSGQLQIVRRCCQGPEAGGRGAVRSLPGGVRTKPGRESVRVYSRFRHTLGAGRVVYTSQQSSTIKMLEGGCTPKSITYAKSLGKPLETVGRKARCVGETHARPVARQTSGNAATQNQRLRDCHDLAGDPMLVRLPDSLCVRIMQRKETNL